MILKTKQTANILIKSKLLIALFFIASTCFCQSKTNATIKLKSKCFFDKQNRKKVCKITNQTAIVSKQGSYIILTIKNKKYFTCNIPSSIQNDSIKVTGYILEIFPTERLIATPLKLTRASTFK